MLWVKSVQRADRGKDHCRQLFLVIYDLGLDISGIGKVPRVIIKKGRGVCYG